MSHSYPLLSREGKFPPSTELIALCQAQIDLLTEQLEADRSAVYLTKSLSTDLIPIIVYPPVTPPERENDRLRSLNPFKRETDSLAPVKLEDLSTVWPENEPFFQSNRLILPLMYEEQMMGLLVTDRDNRQWEPGELTRVEKIARTLAIACLLDRKQQWTARQLQEERYRYSWERERLDTFLHQLRNPLTALKTFGKLLLKRLLPESANQSTIRGILRESDRMRDLISEFETEIDNLTGNSPTIREIPQLLGQPSPTAFLLPATETDLDPIALNEILDPLILSASAVAKERNICLNVTYSPDLPSVRANATGLREVFSNLLDNALKYTPAGGRVEVGGRRIKDEVEIEISDTGYGIPAEDHDHLFERHYRGVQGSGTIPGTGLGLAIAKDLIERMGGSIEFISPNPTLQGETYPGTVFRVRLPLPESSS